jgi:hypothetical protein
MRESFDSGDEVLKHGAGAAGRWATTRQQCLRMMTDVQEVDLWLLGGVEVLIDHLWSALSEAGAHLSIRS